MPFLGGYTKCSYFIKEHRTLQSDEGLKVEDETGERGKVHNEKESV